MTALRWISILLVGSLWLTSCASNRQIARTVDRNTLNFKIAASETPHIVISDSAMEDQSVAAKCKTVSASVIPAIFYWRVNKKTLITINPKLPSNIVRSVLQKCLDSSKFLERHNAAQVTISLKEIPQQFYFSTKTDVIYLLFVAAWRVERFLDKDQQHLVAQCIIYKTDGSTKTEIIKVPTEQYRLSGLPRFSDKKFIAKYLKDYERQVRQAAYALVSSMETSL
jgi:hypothetical protein